MTVRSDEPIGINVIATLTKPISDLVVAYAIKTIEGARTLESGRRDEFDGWIGFRV